MNCPKCEAPMEVTHTYAVASSRTQRHKCTRCQTVAIVANVAVVLAVNPERGQGAEPMSKRLGARLSEIEAGIKSAV